MPLTISCPSCGLTDRIPEDFVATEAPCPRCGIALPVAETEFAESEPAAAEREPAQPLDAFFAQVAVQKPAEPAASPPETAPPAPVGEMLVLEQPDEREWLREERQRLESAMAKHFAQLQQQREEFAGWRTQAEHALMLREHELHRLHKQVLRRRQELTVGEARANASDPTGAGLLTQVRQEVQEQEAVRNRLQSEIAQLQQAADRARKDWQALEETIRKRKHAWEAEEARWQSQIKQLQQRQVNIVKAEDTLRRKQAEIKGLEKQISTELERREQQLAHHSAVVDQRRQEVMQTAQEADHLRRRMAQITQYYESKLKQAALDQEKSRQELAQAAQENESLRQKVAALSKDAERSRPPLRVNQPVQPVANRPRGAK